MSNQTKAELKQELANAKELCVSQKDKITDLSNKNEYLYQELKACRAELKKPNTIKWNRVVAWSMVIIPAIATMAWIYVSLGASATYKVAASIVGCICFGIGLFSLTTGVDI